MKEFGDMNIRCSKLPLAKKCPSSASRWQWPIDGAGDAAELGTVVHAVLAAMVRGQEPELTTIARPSGVDVGEVERLVNYGKKAWGELSTHFRDPRAEVGYDYSAPWGSLSGTCDVDADPPVILDWKTGQVYRDHKEQMRGYAAISRGGRTGVIKAVIVWLQLGFYEVYDFTEADTDALVDTDIPRLLGQIGKKYSPDADCSFCPGRAECPAKAAYERMAANALVAVGPEALSRDRLAALYPQARLLEAALTAYDAMLHAALADGPLPLPDGRQIGLRTIKKQEILARQAWPVLTANGYTLDDMAACVKIGKEAMLDVIKSRSAKGQKGRDAMLLLDALKAADAINETSFQKLQVSKATGEKHD